MQNITLSQPETFSEKFVEEYLDRGLGSMQKRETDILVMYLLMTDGALPVNDYYSMSRLLKMSETRVKNLVYQVELKYGLYDEYKAREDFVELIKNGSIEDDGNGLFTFIIIKPMLRQYFEEWVARQNGFTDSSFNRSLVKISEDLLVKIIEMLIKDEDSLKKIQEHLFESEPPASAAETIKVFIRKFLCKKAEGYGGDLLEYAALLLRRLILGF